MNPSNAPNRRSPSIGIATLMLSASMGFGEGGEKIDFGRDVQPILAEHCYACHGPDAEARKAKLRLDVRENAIAERKGYAPIVPGDAEASELVALILSDDEDEVTPFSPPLRVA